MLKSAHRDTAGFTLIEVAAVIVLFAVMSVLAISNFGLLDSYRGDTELRKFISVWELVAADSQQRGESYRLIIDLDDQSYTVRREVPLEEGAQKKVDYLENFRRKMGRKKLEDEEPLLSVEEEYKREDLREGDTLESIFLKTFYHDANEPTRLGTPLSFPSLAERQRLPESLRIRDVQVGNEKFEEGEVSIRFSSTGMSDFAVVHLVTPGNGRVQTAHMNPANAVVKVEVGDQTFNWLGGTRDR